MNRHPRQNHDETQHPHRSQRGATLVEYMLMLSLIVLAALAGVSAFGGGVSDNIDDSAERVVAVGGTADGG